ncbi:hypothetical protein [Pseudomonas putida]|uniref:Uncharacterized protein n=1 Tax=Pseudomonas putida TaxID=303 RepID=A0A8I1EBE1_PSEPU|nr:hypothetical protein [Pseudomonas putida]MBI6882401.1 hypothetical protein [Pseudomonas putida]
MDARVELARAFVRGDAKFDLGIHGSDEELLLAMSMGGLGTFKRIPGELLTPALIENGALSTCEMLDEIYCYVQGDPAQTFLTLIAKGHSFHSVHPALLTKEMIEESYRQSPHDTIRKRGSKGDRVHALYDTELMIKAVSEHITLLTDLDKDELQKIPDEVIAKSFSGDPGQGFVLERCGKFHILVEAVKDGLWPADMELERPSNLRKAMKLRLQCNKFDLLDILPSLKRRGFPLMDAHARARGCSWRR